MEKLAPMGVMSPVPKQGEHLVVRERKGWLSSHEKKLVHPVPTVKQQTSVTQRPSPDEGSSGGSRFRVCQPQG